MSENFKGYSDGDQFRAANRYEETDRLFKETGLFPEGPFTPTVGMNIVRLGKMRSVQSLSETVRDRKISATVLGISTVEGPADFQLLLKALGASKVLTVAIDVSDGIFNAIKQTDLDEITCLQRDARETGLPSESQDFVLRDHIGNCCPPEIDRVIDQEAIRILKPGGIAIVNITTNDLLRQSNERAIVSFSEVEKKLGTTIISALQQRIYDLNELKQLISVEEAEQLRGSIMEIEEHNSFVVFGEDPQGHGEWFRSMVDHQQLWKKDGFTILEISPWEGWDRHNPPLRCLRHNVVMKKI